MQNLQKKFFLVVLVFAAFALILLMLNQSIGVVFSGITIIMVYGWILLSSTRSAGKKIWSCVGWLLLIPLLVGAIVTALVNEYILVNIDENVIISIVMMASILTAWIFMALYGDKKTTYMAIIILGGVCIILNLAMQVVIDFTSMDKLITVLNADINELNNYGYDVFQLGKLMTNIFTYPTIISSIVAFIILKYKEYWVENRKLN